VAGDSLRRGAGESAKLRTSVRDVKTLLVKSSLTRYVWYQGIGRFCQCAPRLPPALACANVCTLTPLPAPDTLAPTNPHGAARVHGHASGGSAGEHHRSLLPTSHHQPSSDAPPIPRKAPTAHPPLSPLRGEGLLLASGVGSWSGGAGVRVEKGGAL
jgi:hypothetical protein